MRKNVPKISQPQEIIHDQLRGYDSGKLHNRRSGSPLIPAGHHIKTMKANIVTMSCKCQAIAKDPLDPRTRHQAEKAVPTTASHSIGGPGWGETGQCQRSSPRSYETDPNTSLPGPCVHTTSEDFSPFCFKKCEKMYRKFRNPRKSFMTS